MPEPKEKKYTFLVDDGVGNQPVEFYGKTDEEIIRDVLEWQKINGVKLNPWKEARQLVSNPLFTAPQDIPASGVPARPADPMGTGPAMDNETQRFLLRSGAAGILGRSPVAGVVSGVGGHLLDKFFDQPDTPVTGGEFAGEVVGSLIPGLGTALKGAKSPVISKAAQWLNNSPILGGAATGAAAGATAAGVDNALHGNANDPAQSAVFGALGGFAGGALSKYLHSAASATPAIMNSKAGQIIKNALGVDAFGAPNPAARGDLQATSKTMQEVDRAVGELEKTEDPFLREQLAILRARTTPRMQAGRAQTQAETNVLKARAEEALKRVQEKQSWRALKEEEGVLRDRFASMQKTGASTIGRAELEADIAANRAKQEAHELSVAVRRADYDKNLAGLKKNLQTAEGWRASVDAIANKAKRKEDQLQVRQLAADTIADDIKTRTGFDPRKLSPDERAAVKWLANDNPEAIAVDFMEQGKESAQRALGVVSLLGKNSKEIRNIRDTVVQRLFGNAHEKTGPFAMRGIDPARFAEGVQKISPTAWNAMYDNPEAYKTLVLLTEALSKSASKRGGAGFQFSLTPNEMAAAASAPNAERGRGVSWTVGLFLGHTLAGLRQQLPRFMDAVMEKNNVFGKAVRQFAENPNAQTSINLLNLTQQVRNTRKPTAENQPESPAPEQ